MNINEERENIFKALDFYLRDTADIDKLGVIEDLVYAYTGSRDIRVKWIEIY